MMNPLILDGYEIYQFNKTSTGYTTQVGNDILEIKGGTTPIVPLFNAPPGVIHQTMVVYNDMQNQWSSEYFDKHKAAVSNLFAFTQTQFYIVYVAIHMYTDGSIVEIGYKIYQNGSLGTIRKIQVVLSLLEITHHSIQAILITKSLTNVYHRF